MPRPSSSASADPVTTGGSVLVVCTGNVCRSPFLQLALQRQLEARRRHGEPGITVTSAGTGALTGQPMDERAAAQATARGLDPGRSWPGS